MEMFFIVLLQCTLSMSVITLLYAAVLPILSKRYAAKWCYLIWLVIAAGWIFPFRPRIDLSFLPVQIVMPVQTITINTLSATTVAEQTVNASETITLWLVLATIWILGVGSMVLFHAVQHIRFMKTVRRWSEPITDVKRLEILGNIKADLNLKAQIKINVCQSVACPMLIGFFRPTILLPPVEIGIDEFSFVLKHELIHYMRHDLWYKAMILAATTLHWFNPLVYIMAKLAAVQCEISCDAMVLQGADFERRKQYSETIIGVVRNGVKLRTAISTNFYGGKKGMKNRISSIMDMKRKRAGAFILCLVVLSTLGTGAIFAVNAESMSEAYSIDTPISAQDQEKLNRQAKEAIAKTYAVYEKYGLTYEKETDNFYYDGKMVRYFSDKLDAEGAYNAFTRSDGVVDLMAVRNADYELTGISPVSQEVYDKHTESMKNAQNVQGAVQENGSINKTSGAISVIENSGNNNSTNGSASAFYEGEPNYADTSLGAYLSYGVTYNMTNKQWIFDNRPIHYLNDEGNVTFVDNSDNTIRNGVSLEVIRKSNGEIEKLIEIITY
jgi:beta-lactamase regulating signal transducer with metallopeptidase domain